MLVIALSLVILVLSIYNLFINTKENSDITRDIIMYSSIVLSTLSLAISIYDVYPKQVTFEHPSGIKDFEEILQL